MSEMIKIPSPDERFTNKYLQRKYPEFYEWLDKEYTNTLTGSIIEKLYQYFNGIKEPPLCKVCKNNYTQFTNIKKGYTKHCSCKCAQNDPVVRKKFEKTNIERYGFPNAAQSKEVQDKMKRTCKEIYGVENAFASKEIQNKIKEICMEKYGCEYVTQSKEVQEKIKQTNIKKYGVEYPQQSPEIRIKSSETSMKNWGTMWTTQSDNFKEKSRQTNLKKRGVEYPQQSPEVREKTKQTFLEKYGVDNPNKSKEIQEKSKQTNLKKRGVEYPQQSPEVREKTKQTNLEKYGVDNVSKNEEIQKKKEETCMKNYEVPYGVFTETAKESLRESGINQTSKFEICYLDYIEELIKPYGWTLERNCNEILDNKKELDGYIPEINKAFEFNGVYWHSLKIIDIKKKDQHTIKTIQCAEKNIKLLYVWEDVPFKLGCELIRDFIFNKPLDKYKKILYTDLNDNQWPCDFGVSKEDIPNIKEHIYSHRNNNCYDSGYIEILQ